MKSVVTLCVLFLCVFDTSAQSIISGKISAESNETSEGSIITAMAPSDSAIIGYALTDEKGTYRLEINSTLQSILLRLSGYNIKTEWKKVSNKTQLLDWKYSEESIKLKEVQIKAQKMWGYRDTLNYLVAAYTKDHDITIGDVLKSLPGITVKDDGTVLYQGVSISKFYIENMDVLQGRYNIATEGIKATDVATVQVLEHHEPIKSLSDQAYPDNAALNLKLKENSKGKWLESLDMGIGWDKRFLWNIVFNAMYFGKNAQHTFVYDDSNRELFSNKLTSHYGGTGIYNSPVAAVLKPSMSPIGKSVYDVHHQFSSNNVWKLDKDDEIHLDISYSNEHRSGDVKENTTYLMSDGSDITTEETQSSKSTDNTLAVNSTYEKNGNKNYLKNSLNFVGMWQSEKGNVVSQESGMDGISQRDNTSAIGINNQTEWICRTRKGNGFRLNSSHTFQTSPQTFSVSPGVFGKLLGNADNHNETAQKVRVTQYSSDNDFSLVKDLRVNRFILVPTIHTNIHSVHMSSELTGAENGYMNYFDADMWAGLCGKYVLHNFLTISVNMPLSLSVLSAKREKSSINNNHWFFNPDVNLRWAISSLFSMTAGANISTVQTPWQQLYTANLLTNYRNLSHYDTDISYVHVMSGNTRFTFKDIDAQFFGWVEICASRTKNNVIYGVNIDDKGYTVIQSSECPNINRQWGSEMNLRKDFDWAKLSLSLTAGHSEGRSQYIRQNILDNLHSVSNSLDGSLSIEPISGWTLSYTTDYNVFMSNTENDVHTPTARTWQNNVTMTVSLMKNKMLATVHGYHLYNNLLSSDTNYFLDGELMYIYKSVHFMVKADNLLNTRSYTTFSTSNMMKQSYEYQLRPRSIMLEVYMNI